MTFKPHPGFIPPWMDAATLAAHLCICEGTVDAWVRHGILPPPKMKGGKRMWRWADVDRQLDDDGTDMPSSADLAERVRHATSRKT